MELVFESQSYGLPNENYSLGGRLVAERRVALGGEGSAGAVAGNSDATGFERGVLVFLGDGSDSGSSGVVGAVDVTGESGAIGVEPMAEDGSAGGFDVNRGTVLAGGKAASLTELSWIWGRPMRRLPTRTAPGSTMRF